MNTQDNIRMESQKDPAQLEREIDQQRNHIEQIMSALENKLSPGEIFDRVLNLGKGGGREFAGNLTDTIKANPVPALLTAAGLIWLYSGRDKPPGGATSSSYGMETTTAGLSSAHAGSTGTASLDEQHGGVREKLGNARSRVSESAHHAAGSVRERARGAKESARRGATRANEGFQHLLDENPMAAGAIGIAVGALLGSLIPATNKEDEWMGETSDRITGKAKEMARAGRDSLASAGREMTGSASSGDTGTQRVDSGSGGSFASTTTASSTPSASSPSRPH